LQVYKQFDRLTGNEVALHLVEISPYLASIQAKVLCSRCNNTNITQGDPTQTTDGEQESLQIDPFREVEHGKGYYHHAVATETGFPVYWYRNLKDVPQEFNFYVAHEFFDALPIHKLQVRAL
jgi:NADH dehydrogenase [ubiquinone] 1 alpha subcomplex assembly factor 7